MSSDTEKRIVSLERQVQVLALKLDHMVERYQELHEEMVKLRKEREASV